MTETAAQSLWKNFLGNSPTWYKKTIIAFLLLTSLFFGAAVMSAWLVTRP